MNKPLLNVNKTDYDVIATSCDVDLTKNYYLFKSNGSAVDNGDDNWTFGIEDSECYKYEDGVFKKDVASALNCYVWYGDFSPVAGKWYHCTVMAIANDPSYGIFECEDINEHSFEK